jgi:hypothetical protein
MSAMVRAGWLGIAVLAATACGSDDASGTGFGDEYRVIEVRQDDTCSGVGVVLETDPALEFFDLADVEAGIEWRTCSAEGACEGTGEPVGLYPRRFDVETADGWRGWLEESEDAGSVCNYFFYEITLRQLQTELQPAQIELVERERRETRSMDSCERPAEVTVDSASCLAQRFLLAIPR